MPNLVPNSSLALFWNLTFTLISCRLMSSLVTQISGIAELQAREREQPNIDQSILPVFWNHKLNMPPPPPRPKTKKRCLSTNLLQRNPPPYHPTKPKEIPGCRFGPIWLVQHPYLFILKLCGPDPDPIWKSYNFKYFTDFVLNITGTGMIFMMLFIINTLFPTYH